MVDQSVSRSPSKLSFVKRSVCKSVVNTEGILTLELVVEKWFDIPFQVLVETMQGEQLSQHTHIKVSLYQPNLKKAQCFVGTENIRLPEQIVMYMILFLQHNWQKQYSSSIHYTIGHEALRKPVPILVANSCPTTVSVDLSLFEDMRIIWVESSFCVKVFIIIIAKVNLIFEMLSVTTKINLNRCFFWELESTKSFRFILQVSSI